MTQNTSVPTPQLNEQSKKLVSMVATMTGGKGCYCGRKRTSEKVVYDGKQRTVYEGPRGGRYVRYKRTWVRI